MQILLNNSVTFHQYYVLNTSGICKHFSRQNVYEKTTFNT
ncbi:hypothetical protein PaecuDRAFT_3563 [Paenibacillus curdlanolyticus YK9]|uniref:Uncharacterized protein n=1 Tax=Paenibacillus curdlanolyticus YK9 TaxID=717606 RepID=E0ID61_9BACL|nr:hypothetical protein PaecuDRAFT_3563 [Paenibacillus curdlanolyticus YK9]